MTKHKHIEKIVLQDFDEYQQAVKFYYENKARIKKRWLMLLIIEQYEARPEVEAAAVFARAAWGVTKAAATAAAEP